jgi:tryptophan halogenase
MMPGEAAVQRIVIVGGGLEGWYAAAAIANSLQGTPTSIRLIDVQGLVNVEPAQYTLPHTLEFLRRFGIDDAELVRQAGATWRLGTVMHNLCREGDTRIRPFGAHGANIGFVLFHHYLTRLRAGGDVTDYNDWSVNAVAASNDKVLPENAVRNTQMPELPYGLHLNTDKLIELLRARATAIGTVRIEGQPVDTRRNAESGRLEAVLLADGREVEGDLFLDCTGESAMLIGEALGTSYVDWSHWLPCNRRVSVTTKGPPGMPPLLRCTARESGWILQVPLRHRSASQLFYSSECTDDETASNELIRYLGTAMADALAFGETRSGHRQQFWAGNCVAVGTSAGRVEPLDVSDLHLVQSAIARLLRLFPTSRMEQALAEEYNRATRQEYECLRDYQMINYYASEWRGSRFWRRARGADTLESFKARLELFRSRGRIRLEQHETYTREGWVSAYLAADIWPDGYDPLLDSMNDGELRTHFETMRAAIRQAVQAMPSHEQCLNESGR